MDSNFFAMPKAVGIAKCSVVEVDNPTTGPLSNKARK